MKKGFIISSLNFVFTLSSLRTVVDRGKEVVVVALVVVEVEEDNEEEALVPQLFEMQSFYTTSPLSSPPHV